MSIECNDMLKKRDVYKLCDGGSVCILWIRENRMEMKTVVVGAITERQ